MSDARDHAAPRLGDLFRWVTRGWLQPRRRDVVWSFLDQLVISGFGFATGIATGRLVGIEEFGKFAIVMVFVTLASTLHHAVFATPMMTLAGHRPGRSRGYFGAVVLWGSVGALALGLLAAAILAGYFVVRNGTVAPGLAAATGVFVGIQCMLTLFRRMLFARRKGRLAVGMDLGRYLLFVAIVAVLVAEGSAMDTERIAWSLGLSGVVAAAAFVMAVGVSGVAIRGRLALAAAGQHWNIARWLVAVTLVAFGQEQLLLILAGLALGDAPIGGVRAAQYLFGPILVLMSAMENIIPVRAATAYAQGGLTGLKDFLVRFGIVLGALNGGLILLAVLPGATWLHLLFGPAYADYVVILRILGGAAAFSLVRDYLVQYFRAIRSTNAIFYSFCAGFGLAVVLIYPLVEAYGVVGLALDSLASQFASMVYMMVAVSRHYWRHRRVVGHRRVVQV